MAPRSPPSWHAASRRTPRRCAAHYLSNGQRQGALVRRRRAQHAAGAPCMFDSTENAKGPAGKWTEYVAPRVMLRSRDWGLSHRRSTAFTQHNVSAREVRDAPRRFRTGAPPRP